MRRPPKIDRSELLLAMDVGKVLDLTPQSVRALARSGKLRVAMQTKSGTRLFLLADVTKYKADRDRAQVARARGVRGELKPLDAA
jgi:hypothetical protein